MAMTSAFLLVPSAFGLAAGFLAGPAFFAGLAFLPALRAPLGFAVSGADLLMYPLSIALSLIKFLFAVLGVVTVITPVGKKNITWNLHAVGLDEAKTGWAYRQMAGLLPFFNGRQNQVTPFFFLVGLFSSPTTCRFIQTHLDKTSD